MYVYMYVCTHACVHACMDVCMYVCVCVCVYVKYHVPFLPRLCHFGGSRHFALAEKGASELQGYFGVSAE